MDWVKVVGIIITAGTLLVSVTYAIAQRPTGETVEKMIHAETAPVAAAVQEQTHAIKEVTVELRQLREQSIRTEVERELSQRSPEHLTVAPERPR